MAKKKKKKISKTSATKGAKAFNAKFFKIRKEIDAVAQTIILAKKAAGTRKENAKEVAHADAMLASLFKAKSSVLGECCHNDQSCTLFMMKAKTAR